MRILHLRCSEETEEHIWSGHRVVFREVEEVAYRSPFVHRGREPGIYVVYGKTEAGRHLIIVIRYLGKGAARLITARDMTGTERRRYLKHTAH